MLDPTYVLMSINTMHIVLCMVYNILMKTNSVTCVRLLHMKLQLKKIYKKRACNDGVINCGIS